MKLIDFFNNILDYNYTNLELALLATSILLLIIAICYSAYYSKVFVKGRSKADVDGDPISVVVIIKDNLSWVEQRLPAILDQKYNCFEVVAIDLGLDIDISDTLSLLSKSYPNLKLITLQYDSKFPINDKLAYNMGFKAARYQNIVMTTMGSYPVSDYWLKEMGQGLQKSDITLGCSSIELMYSNKLCRGVVRFVEFMDGVRFGAAAVKGNTYRGFESNLGFKKELYFDNRGFNHLNMHIGIDDLFIAKIAKGRSCTVVFNRDAMVTEEFYGGFKRWRKMRAIHNYAKRLYPKKIKIIDITELKSRTFIWIAMILAALYASPIIIAAVATIFATRFIIMARSSFKIASKIGVKLSLFTLLIYDIVAPFISLYNAILRRVSIPHGVWR